MKNKKAQGGAVILFILMLFIIMAIIVIYTTKAEKYNYVGKIVDMEGGSSSNVIILTIDTIGKVPYTFSNRCSNKIRIGQGVYSRSDSDYLWVEYENGSYC